MIFIYGTENQSYVDVFERVFDSALKFMKQVDGVEIELSVVEEDEIKRTNKLTRDIDAVTDVLSFPALLVERKAIKKEDYPYDVNPESGNIVLGEIIICEKRAIEQSQAYAHSVEREMGFLFAHGILHLFGYDHEEKEDEEQMRIAQNEILNKIGLTR